MANDGATFYFDTNIEETVSRVISGLSGVVAATAKIHGGNVQSPLAGLDAQMQVEIRKAQKRIGQLNEEFRKAKGNDVGLEGNLTARYQRVVSALSQNIGALGKKAGINLDVVLDYNRGVIKQFGKLVSNEFQAALNSVALPKARREDLRNNGGSGRVQARDQNVARGNARGAIDIPESKYGPAFDQRLALEVEVEGYLKDRKKAAKASAKSATQTAAADQVSADAATRESKARVRSAKAAETRAEKAEKATKATPNVVADKTPTAKKTAPPPPPPPPTTPPVDPSRSLLPPVPTARPAIPPPAPPPPATAPPAPRPALPPVPKVRPPLGPDPAIEALRRLEEERASRLHAQGAIDDLEARRTREAAEAKAAADEAAAEAIRAATNRWVFAEDRSSQASERLASITEALAAERERQRAYARDVVRGPIPLDAGDPFVRPREPQGPVPFPKAIGAGSGGQLDIQRLESEQITYLRALLEYLRIQSDQAKIAAVQVTANARIWSQINRVMERIQQRVIEAGAPIRAIEAGAGRRQIEGGRPAERTAASQVARVNPPSRGEIELYQAPITDLVRRTVGGELVRTANVRASARNIPRDTFYGPRGEGVDPRGRSTEQPDFFVYPPKDKKSKPKATAAENFKDLTNGTYEDLVKGVIPLTKDFVADTRGKILKIYKLVDDGFEEVERGTTEFFANKQRLNLKRSRQADSEAANLGAGPDAIPTTRKQAKANQRDLTPDGKFAENVEAIGGPTARYVADLRDVREGEERIFKRVKAGFVEIEKGTAEFEAQARALRAQQERQNPARKGILGSFTSGFTQGNFFGGGNDKPKSFGQQADALARSAGTTAKYAALSTVLYGLTGAFSAAVGEVLDFEDSLTEMSVALEALNPDLETSQTTISKLGDAAAIAGANVGQSMDLAAKAVRAFGDETDGSQQSIDDLQVSYVQTASKLATISKTDIADAAGNLSAIAQAFDIPPESFNRVLDVIAGAKQLGGGDEKQIGQGLANAAVALKEAGFSLEQGGAIISEIQKQTDQGGTLIASRLSKISSIVGGSAGKSAILQLNQGLGDDQKVDTTATVKDQIQQLSAVYKDLGEAQRQQLVNSLGGTANARELIITLENANRLIDEADKGFTGKGTEEFQARLKDITATLRGIQGNIKVIIGTLGNSGVLDPLFALAKEGLLPALNILRKMLETFNQIPRPLRTIAFTVGEIYLAFKLIQALSSKGFGGVARSLEGAVRPEAELARQKLAAAEAKKARKAAKQNAVLDDVDLDTPAPKKGKKKARRAAAAAEAARAAAEVETASARRIPRVPNAKLSLNPFRRVPVTTGPDLKTPFDPFHTQPGGPDRPGSGLNQVTSSGGVALKTVLKDGVSSGIQTGFGKVKNFVTAPLTGNSGAVQGRIGAFEANGGLRGEYKFAREAGTNRRGSIAGAIGAGIGAYSPTAAKAGGAFKQLGSAIGVEGLATAGIAAIITANQKTQEIITKAREADRLSSDSAALGGSPDDLREAAKNLKTAADDLHQASSGLLGTVTNGLASVFAGHNISGDSQDDANRLADVYNAAAKRADVGKETGRNAGDLSTQIDLSTPEALATSLEALSAAGYTATDRVNALTGRLEQMATSLTTGKVALTEAQGIQAGSEVGGRVGKEIVNLQTIARDTGQKEKFGPEVKGRRGGRGQKTRTLYSGLDAVAISANTANIAQDFIKSGADVNNKDVYKGLVERYRQQFLKAGLKPEDAKFAAITAANQTRQSITAIGSKAATDNIVSYFENLNANLDASGTEAALKYNSRHKGARTSEDKSGDLVAAETSSNELDRNLKLADEAIAVQEAKGTPEGDAEAKRLRQGTENARTEQKKRHEDVAQKRLSDARGDFDELQAGKPSENVLANLKATEAEIDKELAIPDLDESDRQRLRTEKAGNKIAQQQAALADKLAAGRAALDPRDEIGNAKQDQTDAQTALDDLDARGVKKDSAEYQNALAKKKQADINVAKTQAELDISKRNIGAIPDSSLDTATRDLNDANTLLGTMLVGSIEYNNQLAAVYSKQQALAKVKLDVRSINRQLGIDTTDPVAVADEQATTAREELARVKNLKKGADGKKIDPTVKAQLVGTAELNVRSAEAGAEAAAFQQFLSNAQTAESLGRISHKQYLSMLKSRSDFLAAELSTMKKGDQGYQQKKDEYDQLQQSIKAGADELSGVFNIGDIKVPTPYEVRKAIKDKDFGTILGSNSSTSTAGNVTTDNSTRNLTLNGVPIEEVLAMVKDLFGAKARSRAARKS